jgi:hypothetical protein
MADPDTGLDLGADGPRVSLTQIGFALGLVFAVALAIVVAKKMSTEAMAVVIGIVCGVAASIPTSVLLLVVLNRKERQKAEAERRARENGYPPVVVIQGGAPQLMPQGPQAGYWPVPAPGPPVHRQFHVVGDDDLFVES